MMEIKILREDNFIDRETFTQMEPGQSVEVRLPPQITEDEAAELLQIEEDVE